VGKLYEIIPDNLQAFIRKQHMFFVATAPLSAEGHVNMSPKGLDTFRILSERQVAYLDMTGSGNETAAHLLENGRITFMFCAFEGYPDIVRLYGTGRAVLTSDSEWATLSQHFDLSLPGIRQIITADIDRVSTSCGHGVPLMDFREDRDMIPRWANTKGEAGLDAYRADKNMRSIDGLPTPLAVKLLD
jgi:hypothetical protein